MVCPLMRVVNHQPLMMNPKTMRLLHPGILGHGRQRFAYPPVKLRGREIDKMILNAVNK